MTNVSSGRPNGPGPQRDPGVLTRRMEPLGRGLAAMMTDRGVFLSWRLLCTEDPVFGTAADYPVFRVFRDGAAVAEISGRSNWLDPDGTADSYYSVSADGGAGCPPVRPFRSGANWFDVPLDRPADSPYGPYVVSDVSAGDLDGDGEYELVVLWDSEGKDNSVPGPTGNVLLDAYRMDGSRLWKRPVDLGLNVRAGAHYTQFLVYDFDRDGKSEIMLKTAPGSRDGEGRFVSQASSLDEIRGCDDTADFRDENGMVLRGDEFLTVFRGDCGQAVDTVYYPNQRIDHRLWGDDLGNRSERYLAAVAWLDGKRPCGFFMRGYYLGRTVPGQGRQSACAVCFDGERLRCACCFDTFKVSDYLERASSSSFTSDGRYKGTEGYRLGNELYIGQGNHNCAVADVDGDGRDEVLTGALCYGLDSQDRLGVRWCSFLGHGDAIHLGAYDPGKNGYDLFTVHEAGGRHPIMRYPMDYGMSVLDAATGDILFHCGSPGDMGRGMMADVGAGGSYQIWGISEVRGSDERVEMQPIMRTADGFREAEIDGRSTNFRIFWDGDLYDELLDGPPEGPLEVTSWKDGRMVPVFRTEGCVSIHGTKAVPCLQADLFGDWREEIVMARADNRALRVFTSDIPTPYPVMTLMHDPVYRAGVAAEQTGYNQPPHIGFYLGSECFRNTDQQ